MNPPALTRYALYPTEKAPPASSFIIQISCTPPGTPPLLHCQSARLCKQAVGTLHHLTLLRLQSRPSTALGCLVYSQVQLLYGPVWHAVSSSPRLQVYVTNKLLLISSGQCQGLCWAISYYLGWGTAPSLTGL